MPSLRHEICFIGILMTKSTQSASTSASSSADSAVEQTVVQFAEELGRMIGTVRARADGLLDRKALQAQISRIRDAAADLLERVADRAPGRAARKSNARKSSGRKGAARSRGPVDAPGKRHRKPAPTAHGVKKSDERIAKLRTAAANRRRRRDGQ